MTAITYICIGSLEQQVSTYKLLWPVSVILLHSKMISIREQKIEYNFRLTYG